MQMEMYHRALHAADAYMCGLLGLQLCTRMSLNRMMVQWLGVPEDAPHTCSARLQDVTAAQLRPAAYAIDDVPAPDWWCVALSDGLFFLFLAMHCALGRVMMFLGFNKNATTRASDACWFVMSTVTKQCRRLNSPAKYLALNSPVLSGVKQLSTK